MSDKVLFLENKDGEIIRHFTYFHIQHIEYVMDFSNDPDIISGLLDLDSRINEVIENRSVYTVKFGVREFYESEDSSIDMFSSHSNYRFTRKDVNVLKTTLESILYEHYLMFKPECYFFIGNSPSRVRMYQKMCDNRSPVMLNFQPVTQLGEDSDCFILKTPTYREEKYDK